LLQLNFITHFRVASTCDVLRASWVIHCFTHTKISHLNLNSNWPFYYLKSFFPTIKKNRDNLWSHKNHLFWQVFQKITKLFCSINTQVFFDKFVINELLLPQKITLSNPWGPPNQELGVWGGGFPMATRCFFGWVIHFVYLVSSNYLWPNFKGSPWFTCFYELSKLQEQRPWWHRDQYTDCWPCLPRQGYCV